MTWLLIVATLVSSTALEKLLNGELSYRTSSFISLDDLVYHLNPGRLMMRTDVFVDRDGVDLVESLRRELDMATRLDAVRYFIKRNEPELTQALLSMHSTIQEMPFAFIAARVQSSELRRIAAPLITTLINFMNDRKGRCFYDMMPSAFRDPARYDAIFTPVDPQSYLVVRGEVDSIYGYLIDESRPVIVDHLDERFIRVEPTNSGPIRYVDMYSGCAADVNPDYHIIALFPDQRSMFLFRHSSIQVWFEHTKNGIVIAEAALQTPRDIDVSFLPIRNEYYIFASAVTWFSVSAIAPFAVSVEPEVPIGSFIHWQLGKAERSDTGFAIIDFETFRLIEVFHELLKSESETIAAWMDDVVDEEDSMHKIISAFTTNSVIDALRLMGHRPIPIMTYPVIIARTIGLDI